jgi:hypothetical protein
MIDFVHYLEVYIDTLCVCVCGGGRGGGGLNHKKEYQFIMNHMLLAKKGDKYTFIGKKWFSGTPSAALVWQPDPIPSGCSGCVHT